MSDSTDASTTQDDGGESSGFDEQLVIDYRDEGFLTVTIPEAATSQSDGDACSDETGAALADEQAQSARIGCFCGDRNECVLGAMMLLVGVFALAEVVGGAWSGSLALLSDAFHMLADLLSMAVGFVAIRLARRARTPSKSYGWQRAEIIGALANGVFLLSACLFIVLEAVQRLLDPSPIEQPWMVLGVGIAGLGVNLIGLCMFISHRSLSDHHGHSHGHSHGGDAHGGANLNLHGVFLHILGDALGSLVVIATAIVYLSVKSDDKWPLYADPLCSLLLAGFVARASVPLVRHSVHILMQSVPPHIDLDALRSAVARVDGVLDVHALHVWQMTERRAVGSVHVACRRTGPPFDQVCRNVKRVLHRHDVHETAVQPEFVDSAAELHGHHHHRRWAHQHATDDNAPLRRFSDSDCDGSGYWCRYGRHPDTQSCCDMTSSADASSGDSGVSLYSATSMGE